MQRETPDIGLRDIFSLSSFCCNYIRPYSRDTKGGNIHHEIRKPRKPMIDIPIISDPAHPVFLPTSQTTSGCYRSGINHRKWENSGVTQLLTLTATRCSPPSLMGTHCPRVGVITTLSPMFFRGWKSVAGGSADSDSDSDLDRFRCPCPANRRSIPNLDKANNRPVTYPNLTLSYSSALLLLPVLRRIHTGCPKSKPIPIIFSNIL